MRKVYLLKHDYGHSGDSERDAFISKEDNEAGLENIFISIQKVKLPGKLRFQANFNIVPENDYPLTDLIIPIFSERAEKIISDLGGCEYFLHPVVMFDDAYIGDRFDNHGALYDEVPKIESYSILQILKYHDFFDYDQSEYVMIRKTPRLIKRFVLKEPQDGFPPIFRISETPSSLFLSEKLKEALESSGIKGCVFEEVEVTLFTTCAL